MALVSGRAKNGCLRSYRGEDWQKRVNKNAFHVSNNPQGIIDLGRAENRLCADLMLEKLKSSDVPELHSDVLHYPTSHGAIELREALESFMKKFFKTKIHFTADNLIVTPGAGGALEELIFCIADSGDTVLVPTPFWDKVPKIFTERCQVNVGTVSTSVEENFAITTELLESSLKDAEVKGSKVAGIFVNNPHNPLGKIYSQQEILNILEFAKKHKLHVILDEIYVLSVFDGRSESCSALALDQFPDPDRTHIVWGLSKDFGLSGYRIGVVVSWNTDILQCLRSLAFHNMLPALVQSRMSWLLRQHDWLKDVFLRTSVSRLCEACDRCRKHLEALGVKVLPPQGGLFLWADFSKFLDEPTFAGERRLVERFLHAGVYFRPGHIFYASQPGFFRVVSALDTETVQSGLKRVESVLTAKPEPSRSGIAGLELDLDDLEIVGAGTTKGSSEGMESLIASLKDCIKTSDWLNPEVPDRAAQERVWTIIDPCENSANQETGNKATSGTELGTETADSQPQVQQGATGGTDSLEDMMRSLKQSIKTSDWLKSQEGTWERENPEAAAEYRKAMTESSQDVECKTQ